MTQEKRLILVNPRGFCAGVTRAVAIVEQAIEKYSEETIYVLHEVVHNKHVVSSLRERGAVFVESIHEIPENSIVIFSAHGVSLDIVNEAIKRNLRIIDATCPIVERVHRKVLRKSSLGEEVIMIGHQGHQEVLGTLGHYTNSKGKIYLITTANDVEKLNVNNPANLSFVTQTTLSVGETRNIISALKNKFPEIQGPEGNDICYATQNRQSAVREVSKRADVVLVVGSSNSSNSNRLAEAAQQEGAKSYLINDASELKPEMIKNADVVAVTGGASAPEQLIQELRDCLVNMGYVNVEETGEAHEKGKFRLPSGL